MKATEAQKRATKKYFKTARGREKLHEAIQRYNQKRKGKVLTYYGNGKCACVKCGEKDIACLSIDHINGGGTEHVKRIGSGALYRWLIREGYPKGYQTLCMNCQWKKRAMRGEVRYR